MLTATLSSLAVACGGSPLLIGKHGQTGLASESYPLQVAYADAATHALLPPPWELENVQPGRHPDQLMSKEGGEWTSSTRFDVDGNGEYETTLDRRDYELYFRHAHSGAHLSLSIYPLDQSHGQVDMDVLVRDYVDLASGAGSVTVTMGPGLAVRSERRFASKLIDSAVFTVAGQPAAGATFEIANVDQIQLSKDARWERARVVLIRAPFWLRIRDSTWPLIVRVVYSHRAERFDEHVADFVRLVQALRFGDDEAQFASHAASLFACAPASTLQAGDLRLAYDVNDAGAVIRTWITVQTDVPETADCFAKVVGSTKLAPEQARSEQGMIVKRDGSRASRVGVPQSAAAFESSGWPPPPSASEPAEAQRAEAADAEAGTETPASTPASTHSAD
jgi:hypothetical protein